MDREIGRLVDGLAERGMLEDCLIIVTADHGETFWEHGDFWNHGLSVYQTTVRVPLLLRLPGRMHSVVDLESLLSPLDVLPTVLGHLVISLPATDDGAEVLP